MASNLSRLFSSIIELSTPKLGLQCVRSKPMNHSASRLIFSSTQHRHQENPKEPESEISPPSSSPATKKEGDVGEEAEEGEDEDDVDMNKETGEGRRT
ncbi:hypothetical protein L1049_019934 [Liquidambar formosana]|uniref:Uncharacterized protein n=1 Tax=Liquidambar formosana TaxID=63359 RepID=A0AAP0X6X3_LIQFO